MPGGSRGPCPANAARQQWPLSRCLLPRLGMPFSQAPWEWNRGANILPVPFIDSAVSETFPAVGWSSHPLLGSASALAFSKETVLSVSIWPCKDASLRLTGCWGPAVRSVSPGTLTASMHPPVPQPRSLLRRRQLCPTAKEWAMCGLSCLSLSLSSVSAVVTFLKSLLTGLDPGSD